jgi:hypothetical protein
MTAVITAMGTQRAIRRELETIADTIHLFVACD